MSTAAASGQASDAAHSAANPAASSTGADNLPPLSATSLEDLEKHFAGETNLLPDEGGTETTDNGTGTADNSNPGDQNGNPGDGDGSSNGRPSRISTSQFTDQDWELISTLREIRKEDPNATLKDAVDFRATKQTQNPPGDNGTGNNNDPGTTLNQPPTSDALQGELDALEADLDAHAENDGLLTKDVMGKLRRRDELIRNLNAAREREAVAQSQQQQQIVTSRTASKAAAVALFPAIGVEGSAMHKMTAKIVAEMKAGTHPDSAALNTINAPEIVAQLAAKAVAQEISQSQGISFAKAYASLLGDDAAAPSDTTVPTDPKRVITASGMQGSDPAPKAPTAEQLLSSPDGFDVNKLDALYDQQFGKRGGLIIGLG